MGQPLSYANDLAIVLASQMYTNIFFSPLLLLLDGRLRQWPTVFSHSLAGKGVVMLSGVSGYTKNGYIRLTNTLQLIAPPGAKWGLYFFQDRKKLRPHGCSIKYGKKKITEIWIKRIWNRLSHSWYHLGMCYVVWVKSNESNKSISPNYQKVSFLCKVSTQFLLILNVPVCLW